MGRITTIFHRVVHGSKRSYMVGQYSIRPFTLNYDTAKYGRNTVDMKRVKYDEKESFTAVHD